MTFVFVFIFWIFSLCLHEFAHAAVAYLGGDITVKEKGYLSLNPFKFADPMLSLGLPLIFLFIGGIGLPGGCVYIERNLLRSASWETAVSLAGPLANVILAVVLAAPFYLGIIDTSSPNPMWEAYAFVIVLQICAVMFNLIPLPPLDGYGAISPWFDNEFRIRLLPYNNYGLYIVIGLFWFVQPVSETFWDIVFGTASILGVPPNMAIEGLREFRPF